MWKRERPEPMDLEKVMLEPSPPAVKASPALATAPTATPATAATAATTATPAPSAAPQPPASKVSTLGASLKFKGDLQADEDLVIQGQVEGSILHTRSLTIGAQGRMQGDIRARRIVVQGSVEGNLYALESVTLAAGAKVHGDVFSPKISIDDGARLSGRIDMDNAPAVPTVKVSTLGSPEAPARELSTHEVGALLSRS